MACCKKELSAEEVIALDKKYVWHHLTQHKVFENSDPMIIDHGKGMHVYDIKGKEYLDAVSGGVWTVNVGYGREEIVDAVAEQMKKLCYRSQRKSIQNRSSNFYFETWRKEKQNHLP